MTMIILIFLYTIIVGLSILYYLSKRRFDYWERCGVPFEKPTPLFGNFADYILLRKYWGQVTQELCKKHAKEPYFGVFYGTEPALVVQDPELLKLIITKDFYYFSSREIANYTHNETITQNLFFTQGDRWKVLRQNLTPFFSSAKMKNMFHLIEECCKALESMLEEETNKAKEVDIRSMMVRYTMDCITSSAFGINSNVMGKESNKNRFKIIGELVFKGTKRRGIMVIARSMWPYIFYGLRLKAFPTEVDVFFNKMVSEVFQTRNHKPSPRNDFIDLLLTLKDNKFLVGDSLSNINTESAKKERIRLELTDELLITQCIMFFAAGFETSASTMSYTLFELAKHEAVQKRVLDEVDGYLGKTGGQVTYDCLTDLPYLAACIDEALRLYPVLGVVTREVVAPRTLPTGLCLPRGMRVHLPVYHLHRNPEFFPDPEAYRPERFLGEEKKNIVPYSYMPFGEGPRICIGMRFAKMQMIAGMVTLLKKYTLRLAEGMPRVVELEPTTIVTQSASPIRLTLNPRPVREFTN